MQVKPYKKEFDYSYSIGVYPTIELLTHRPKAVIKVLLSSKGSTNKGVDKILELCNTNHIETEFNDILINKLGGNDNSYAVGLFDKYSTDINVKTSHLVLVNPSDPGNLGTICRTMLAFGVSDLILISPAVDIFDPKTIRASMGAVFGLNYTYLDSFSQYKDTYPNPIYTFMTGGSKLLQDVHFNKPCTLVFGSEGPGLSQEYLNIGTSVQIPQSKDVDSLNLSISVGIVLYTAFSK